MTLEHSAWMARHVEDYNAWAERHGSEWVKA
jgi:hypothetical protein